MADKIRHLRVKGTYGTYEIMWCVKHEDVGTFWSDGSLGCHWEDVVESHGDHQRADLVPLLTAFPARGPLVERDAVGRLS